MQKTLFFLFLLYSLNSSAQYTLIDTTKIPNSKDTIAIKGESYYFKGKRLNSIKLEPFLNEYKSSALEYRKYNNRAIPGGFILLGGIASATLAFINSKKQTHFWTPYTIGEFGLLAIGIPIMISANKHLKKSVQFFNFEVHR